MEIKFSDGEAGFYEASALRDLVRRARGQKASDAATTALLERLQGLAEAHLARPEFSQLTAPQMDSTNDERSWWRTWFGPSATEKQLSAQRAAALERAERAERSSFEALAETARVGRERDEARGRVAALEAELSALRSQP